MHLVEVYIKNFRGYVEEVHIPIDRITAFIGKNDAGKSSVLEALDLFFNQGKFDIKDKNIFNPNDETIVGCVFSDLPDHIVIDDTVITSFEDEYLLNEAHLLEIKKVFSSSGKLSTFIIANHPTNAGYNDLLSKKNTELKTLIRNQGLQDGVNLSINSEMRKALWNSLGDTLTKATVEINADTADEKKLWPRIQAYLPIYRLFKADRPSTDEDAEAQSPMATAMKAAIQEQQEELARIAAKVQEKVSAVADLTIEKLHEISPEIAATLTPQFKKEPAWEKAFSFSLTADNQIPVNKRGSGVRRLVLFSFFRAAAETDLMTKQNIIYAVEEPETSQHPDAQKAIITSFVDLTENGNCQILLTTHVPGLAGLLPLNSLRYVYSTDNKSRVDSAVTPALLTTIADTLGLFPALTSAADEHHPVKLIVCVEGPNDIEFLNAISHTLRQAYDDVVDLASCPSIITISLGGGTLQNWVDHNYLQKLGVREYHIYDGDNRNAHARDCRRVNARGDGSTARETSKREMENYLHRNVINQFFNVDITVTDTMDVSKEVSQQIRALNPEGYNAETVKKKLNRFCAPLMTVELLKDRDPDDEVLGWLRDIAFSLNEE